MTCFPRERRLRSKAEFQSVFSHSQKVVSHEWMAIYKPNEYAYPRLGIIIGKAKVPLAVQRNYLRRLLRESFRQHQEMLKGLDIILLIRSKCSTLGVKQKPSSAIRNHIDELWRALSVKLN